MNEEYRLADFLTRHQINFYANNEVLVSKYAEIYGEFLAGEQLRFELDVPFREETYYIEALRELRATIVSRGIGGLLPQFPQVSDIL